VTTGTVSPGNHVDVAIYRSVLPDLVPDGFDVTGNVPRPPVYVPNVVDNLWEWCRPPQFPSRRLSAFASPTPELARQEGPPNGKVYEISLSDDLKACQVTELKNSREHPEASELPILLYERLGSDWVGAELERKIAAGRLWLPCVSRSEVDRLFDDVPELRRIRAEVVASVRYWDGVKLVADKHDLSSDGEIFFEAPRGYRLTPTD
jgi:hypothetical protein